MAQFDRNQWHYSENTGTNRNGIANFWTAFEWEFISIYLVLFFFCFFLSLIVINIANINKMLDKIRIQNPPSIFSDIIMLAIINIKLTMMMISGKFSFFIRLFSVFIAFRQ
jgi:hypothetical protein